MRDMQKSMVPVYRFPGVYDDKGEWVEFNQPWEQCKLGEILEDFSNKTKTENEYPVLSSTNCGMEVRDGRVSGSSNIGYKIIENDDLVLSPQNLWLGNININNIGKGIVSPSYKTYKVIGVDVKFLLPQLRMPKMMNAYLEASTQGASVVRRNLEVEKFENISLLVPSKVEQKKIGEYFSDLDNLITLSVKEYEKYKLLKQCMLQKMFPQKGTDVPEIRFKGAYNDKSEWVEFNQPWEQRKLGDTLVLLKDGTHGTHQDSEEGPYLLSAKNIKNGQIIIDEDSDRRISQEEFNQIHMKFKLESGDVLLTIVGSIGEAAILENSGNYTFQRSVAFLRPGDNLTSKFLKTQIESVQFQKELNDRKSQSAQPGVYLGDLSKVPMFTTSIDEQEKIGSYFQSIDHLITLSKKKCDAYKLLKKCMLQKMFV